MRNMRWNLNMTSKNRRKATRKNIGYFVAEKRAFTWCDRNNGVGRYLISLIRICRTAIYSLILFLIKFHFLETFLLLFKSMLNLFVWLNWFSRLNVSFRFYGSVCFSFGRFSILFLVTYDAIDTWNVSNLNGLSFWKNDIISIIYFDIVFVLKKKRNKKCFCAAIEENLIEFCLE